MELAIVIAIIAAILAAWPVIFGGKGLLDFFLSREKTGDNLASLDPERESRLVAEYTARVRGAHKRLRFGDPSASLLLAPTEKEASRLSLQDVYTPLSVATEFTPNIADSIDTRPAQLSLDVSEALKYAEARRALVLGDPGSGKSTLVDYLVSKAESTLAVHIRLSQLDPSESGAFWTGVTEVQKLNEAGSLADLNSLLIALEKRMLASESLLVFDGLDEVQDNRVTATIAEILRVSDVFPLSRIVVTCRLYDYYQDIPNRKLPFTKLRLLPFKESDMLDYVDKWYSALERLEYLTDAQARKRNLQDALRNSSELSQLGATPLLLTLMAMIHTTEGELPKARAVLFHKTATHLLSETPQWRRSLASATVPVSELLPLAQRLAYEIHRRDETSERPIVGVTVAEIEQIIQNHIGYKADTSSLNHTRHKAQRARIDDIVTRLVNSNGLLSEAATGKYNFSHKSLKEFLAGMQFLNSSDLEFTRTSARVPHWREPVILMAGYGGREGNALYFLSKLIECIILDSSNRKYDGLYLKNLAGEMLAEIGAETLRLRGQAWVVDGENEPDARPSLWKQVVAMLFDAHKTASSIERIKIFQVLGKLGDPRLVNGQDEVLSPTKRLTFLPSTSIVIGDDEPGRPPEKSSLVVTVPLREIEVQSMHVSIYTVTNREFADFIADDGYHRDELWPENGKLWLKGERAFTKRLSETTARWIERDFGPELKVGKFRLADVLRDASEMSRPRTEPFYWRNARYNNSNQPVVGVNLWEAIAYCNWLQNRLQRSHDIEAGTIIRLPTEWEWERMSRGTKQRSTFPWGEAEPTSEYAHTRADGLALDFAAPVGCFPFGRTDHHVWDVAGNVWEWTLSQALPPEVNWDHARNNISDVVDVVVRGGSWFSNEPRSIRCGYRGIDLPQNVYYDVGFRAFVFNHTPTI